MEMKHPYLFQLACLVVVQFLVKARILIVDPLDRVIDYLDNTDATIFDKVLQGYIESPNPPDACTSISPPTYPSNYTMLKFALINGTSECDLITKMQNLAAVGYEVAIVYDPSPEPFHYNIKFPITTSQVNVSVVIILYEEGVLIKDNYLFHNLSDKDTMTLKIFPAGSWGSFTLRELFIKLCLIILFLLGLILLFLLDVVYDVIKEKIQNCLSRNNAEHVRGREGVNEHAHVRGREGVNAHFRQLFHGHASIHSEEFDRAYEEGQFERLQKNLNIRFPSVQYSEDDRYDACVICCAPFVECEKIRVLKKCGHGNRFITFLNSLLI